MRVLTKCVEKIVVKGVSGIIHELEIIRIGKEKYVYINLTKESIEKSLGKVLSAYDVGMKCAIVVNGNKPLWIKDVFERIGGILLEEK